MRTHQITGIGPTNADGSVELFTILPKPFVVTAAWLAAQSGPVAVGSDLVEDAAGDLTLAVTDAEQAVLDAAAAQAEADAQDAAAAEAQKKTAGLAASGDGSAPSQDPQPETNETIQTVFHQRLMKCENFLKELAADFGKVF